MKKGSIWCRVAARMVSAVRRQRERGGREMLRLRQAFWESERLRAELSHLEREIQHVRDSAVPDCQKALLERVLWVRYRRLENEMLVRQNEINASGYLWNGG